MGTPSFSYLWGRRSNYQNAEAFMHAITAVAVRMATSPQTSFVIISPAEFSERISTGPSN
jgi:hypothetical protein